jgi:hypothetical protein
MNSSSTSIPQVIPQGTRTEGDDFYCHKYRIWYKVEDCVYRGRNRTFSGCVDCLQGYLNIRSVERGLRPPAFLGSNPSTTPGSKPGTVLPLKRAVLEDTGA